MKLLFVVAFISIYLAHANLQPENDTNFNKQIQKLQAQVDLHLEYIKEVWIFGYPVHGPTY